MTIINLTKMNGTGNDFLIFDARATENEILRQNLKDLVIKNIPKLSARTNQITKGCDQFLILENTTQADVFMNIYNADGSEVDACGNATRAIGWWLCNEVSSDKVTIKTVADILTAEQTEEFEVSVDMGQPRLEWQQIPLSKELDTLSLPIEHVVENLTFKNPVAVSMGNPHMVFFTTGVDELDLAKIAAPLEVHPFYPKKTNVEFAEIIDKNNINLRVFERGVGETLSCGTGACATLVAAVRRGLTERNVTIKVKGGVLGVNWNEQTNHVHLSGKIEVEGFVEVEL
jgi:diaminopimelate epimerase